MAKKRYEIWVTTHGSTRQEGFQGSTLKAAKAAANHLKSFYSRQGSKKTVARVYDLSLANNDKPHGEVVFTA